MTLECDPSPLALSLPQWGSWEEVEPRWVEVEPGQEEVEPGQKEEPRQV